MAGLCVVALPAAVFGATLAPEPVAASAEAATAKSLPHRTSPSAMVHSKTGKLSCEQAVRTSDIAHTSSTVSITTIRVEELMRIFSRSSGVAGEFICIVLVQND